MTVFTEKPLLSIKEVFYVIGAVVAIVGQYAANAYNINTMREEMTRYVEIQKKDNEYSWEAIRNNADDLKSNELMLRKIELDIARYISEKKL